MKVKMTDLGILKQAEFDVGNLTIICGANNTGKTYATYALYGFLQFWNEYYVPKILDADNINELIRNGSLKVVIDNICNNVTNIIDEACREYLGFLPTAFGAHERNFEKTRFNISLIDTSIDFVNIEIIQQLLGPAKNPFLSIHKRKGNTSIIITVENKADWLKGLDKNWLLVTINQKIMKAVSSDFFPVPFIASIERTGAAMFQRELDVTRNRLLEHISNKDNDINNPFALMDTINDRRYALPVRDDVDFNRSLFDVSKYESKISKENPEIINSFDMVLGGEYKVQRDGIFYVPGKSRVRLSMGESASSVRSLLNLGIYLKHIAKPGGILMIDEPELNLHPKNQRLMARLLAMLINAGIKVFITTHSDYILKEINTLIMLSNSLVKLENFTERTMEKYGYRKNELLESKALKVYIAQNDLIEVEGSSKRQRHNTFVPAPIDENGVEVSAFDETIDKMNEIQDWLLFGGN